MRKSLSSRALLAGSAMFVLMIAATPAMAQQAASDDAPATTDTASGGLEDIVVTARRVEENLQDVPISVTAYSGETLEELSASNLNDLGNFAPNTRLRHSPADPTSIVVQIRGQVQTDILVTLDPSVGTYVDGIYWARAFGANASLLDIERAEVLKGPQGTLFGRNTTGGALNLKTKDPVLDSLSGSLSGTVGNHELFELTGIVNVPLVEDKVALRLAGVGTSFGGYGTEQVTGSPLNDYGSWLGRAKLLLQPTEDLRVLFSAEKYRFRGAGSSPVLLFAAPNSPAVFEVLAESGGRDSIFNYVYDGERSPFDIVGGFRPFNRADTETYSGTATYDLGWGTLTAIVGHRSYETHRNENLDGTPYTVLTAVQDSEGDQWSQELQLTGNAFDDRFAFTLGVFNFDEKIPFDSEQSFAFPAINPNAPARSEGAVRNKAKAAYGQGNFAFSDTFSVTAGLRYSSDRRQLKSSNNTGPARACSVPLALRINPAVCLSNQKRKDDGWTYTLSANYEPSPDLLFYAKTAKGIRSGGFQLRGGATVTDYTPFDPETVTDYEVGVKSELFGRRVRFNAAAFYSDYQDIQRSTIVARAGGGLSTIVSNAAQARVLGGEAELTAIPIDGLELSGAIGITRPKYKRFDSASGDRSNEEFENVPKFTAAVSAQYTVRLLIGELSVRGDYSYTSKQVQARNTRPPFTETPPYSLVNARAALKLENNVELAVFARNLFNNRYRFYSLDLFGAGLGVVDGFYGAPRQIGFQGTIRFGE